MRDIKKSGGVLCQGVAVKYAGIDTLRQVYPLWILCCAFQVSISGYHDWKKRFRQKKTTKDLREVTAVKAAHIKTRGVYGALRLHQELLAEGHHLSLWKVKKIRREEGLTISRARKRISTTNSNHKEPVADNILDRQFTQQAPDRVWVSDITYIPTDEGWLYLAGIKDIFTKEIVGFHMADTMDKQLVLTALQRAYAAHRPTAGLLLHSDRGSQYCSHAYQETINKYKMICSMSRKGECHDNAPMESFWGLLKNELVYLRHFRTHGEAVQAITEYITIFYNRQRRQAALDYLSPAAFAQNYRQGRYASAA